MVSMKLTVLLHPTATPNLCLHSSGLHLRMVKCCSAKDDGFEEKLDMQSRRVFTTVLIGTGLGSLSCNTSQDAQAGLDKYFKKKKLDPLETYIPTIILCQSQFRELEARLLGENPQYQDARSLLRSGPAGSLRTNIRAVAAYAAESGDGKVASDAVDLCLSSLEDLDSLLFRALRNDSSITVETMKEKLGTSIGALDRLLQTVPGPILEKGKAAASAYLDDSVNEDEAADIDIKSLEDLL